MDCKEARKRLIEYDKAYPDDILDSHLSLCKSCMQISEIIDKTIHSFQYDTEPSPFLSDKILNNLASRNKREFNTLGLIKPYLIKTAYAALLIFAGIYIGILISGQKTESKRELLIKQMAKQMRLDVDESQNTDYFIFY